MKPNETLLFVCFMCETELFFTSVEKKEKKISVGGIFHSFLKSCEFPNSNKNCWANGCKSQDWYLLQKQFFYWAHERKVTLPKVLYKKSKYQKLQWKTYQWQQLTTSCRHKTTDKRLVSHKDQKSQPRFRKRDERCLNKEKNAINTYQTFHISSAFMLFTQ